jgi:DNA-binding transcriptional ArsR family regulator
MRSAPEAMIRDWAESIGKSRSSTLSALKRLRDAGLAESLEGKWRLTKPDAPREPAPKWIAPLSGAHRAHAPAGH